MTFRLKAMRGSVLLGGGQMIGYAAAFARNMLLARALSKEDFGVSAAFSLTITAFEMSNKMAIGQQVVQSRVGDSEQFQANAQFCQFIAGALGSSLILLLGGLMADLFRVPNVKWAFSVISLVGLLNGLQHLDVVRLTRHMCFGRKVVLDVLPDTVTTLAAVILLHWLTDYRVVVVLLVGKAFVGTALTHGLAQRRYRWAFTRDHTRSILAFGWPLLLNSLLMFGYTQGDQVLIGALFSVASMALYSLATQITTVPATMFLNVLSPVFLPLLSRAQNNQGQYLRHYVLCSEIATISAALIACFFITSGGLIMVAAFGSKYAGGGAIVMILTIASAFRIVRGVPTIAAMARGDTINNLFSNIARVVSLPLAAIAVLAKSPMAIVAGCAIVGEVLALLVAWYRLRVTCGVPIWTGLKPTIAALIAVAACTIPVALITSRCPLAISLLINVAGCCIAALFMVAVSRELIRRLIEEFSKISAAAPLTCLLSFVARKASGSAPVISEEGHEGTPSERAVIHADGSPPSV